MAQEIIVVRGNNTLAGDVSISGAKNSALKLMAASILSQGECIIDNVPAISDISVMSEVLTTLGAKVECLDVDNAQPASTSSTSKNDSQANASSFVPCNHRLIIDASQINSFETPYELVSKMRASISVLGPLIARFGEALVAMPGGCQIGARGIDMHLKGLEALGVEFAVEHGYLHATTPHGLKGAHVVLDFPSVGATENMLMAAIVADGETCIENAAREPEIVDLADMLCAMGARVYDAGTSLIRIEGVPLESLHACTHTTCGDRIEAGTFLVGGALTGGPVTVHGINPTSLHMAIVKLREMGCTVSTDDNSISIKRTHPLNPVDIQTLPYPGFPTDLQAQFMLLAACAEGTSVITENIFENRFMFAAELARMGANIVIEEHHSLIRGGKILQGAPVSSTDLRAGAALVLAGIVAQGKTHVHRIDHIDRGYENYVEKLRSLGADVERRMPYNNYRTSVHIQ